MMAEGLDAAADLSPLRLLDGFARQLNHHAHAVGQCRVEQLLEVRFVRIDGVFGFAGRNAVVMRAVETGLAHFLEMAAAIHSDGKLRLARDAQETVRADLYSRFFAGTNGNLG